MIAARPGKPEKGLGFELLIPGKLMNSSGNLRNSSGDFRNSSYSCFAFRHFRHESKSLG